jgi:hypothetical protein
MTSTSDTTTKTLDIQAACAATSHDTTTFGGVVGITSSGATNIFTTDGFGTPPLITGGAGRWSQGGDIPSSPSTSGIKGITSCRAWDTDAGSVVRLVAAGSSPLDNGEVTSVVYGTGTLPLYYTTDAGVSWKTPGFVANPKTPMSQNSIGTVKQFFAAKTIVDPSNNEECVLAFGVGATLASPSTDVVFFSRSADAGNTWTLGVSLTDYLYEPIIAAGGHACYATRIDNGSCYVLTKNAVVSAGVVSIPPMSSEQSDRKVELGSAAAGDGKLLLSYFGSIPTSGGLSSVCFRFKLVTFKSDNTIASEAVGPTSQTDPLYKNIMTVDAPMALSFNPDCKKFLAVTIGGGIYSSPDGLSWEVVKDESTEPRFSKAGQMSINAVDFSFVITGVFTSQKPDAVVVNLPATAP